MKKKTQIEKRICQRCLGETVIVNIMLDEKLFNKLKTSYQAHVQISAKIIKDMIEMGTYRTK